MATDPEGRKVIPMAERVSRPSAPLGEVGRTGTQSFHGFIQTDEYVPELTGLSGLRTLDKMRRSDGMIRAVLRAIVMPLLSATWAFQPATEDPEDLDIAAECEDGLFDGMTTGWAEVLRQILTFLPLGFAVFEKVWEVRDVGGEQKVMPRKLAPRLQRTIFKMNTDKGGGLTSVTQQTFGDDGFETIDIDIDRLLVFVNDKEGAQWFGTPILRSAYKHWWIKDNLYRIQAMAAERWGVGIPSVTLPPDQSDDENIRKAENILAAMRSHEKGYVVWPAGYTFQLITSSTGGSSVMDLEPIITHHDRMIAVSVLAQFLTLGATDTGSWALSNDQSALFLMVEQSIGDLVCDVINRHLVPEWVDYNRAGVKAYPKLTVTNIETRNMEKILVGLAAAATSGLINPDPDLEDALRDGLGFPLIPRDENGDPLLSGMENLPLPPGVVDTTNPTGTPGVQGIPGGAPPTGAATNPTAPQGTQPATAPAPAAKTAPPPRLNRKNRKAGRRVFADQNDAATAALLEGDPAKALRIMAGLDDVSGGPALIPNLVLAANYPAENAQIAHNTQTPHAKAKHKWVPARYTHSNGDPRCLLCGAGPSGTDALHTSKPPTLAVPDAPPEPAPADDPKAKAALKTALDDYIVAVGKGDEPEIARTMRVLEQMAFKPKRPLTAIEEHVDFESLDSLLRESRARIRDAAESPVQVLIRGLAERAARAVKAGDTSQLQADALKFDTTDLEAAIKSELDHLYVAGANEVRKELASQIAKVRQEGAASATTMTRLVEAVERLAALRS